MLTTIFACTAARSRLGWDTTRDARGTLLGHCGGTHGTIGTWDTGTVGHPLSRLQAQCRQVRRAAVEVGNVLKSLAQSQHVALGVGLADDLDADRQAAR